MGCGSRAQILKMVDNSNNMPLHSAITSGDIVVSNTDKRQKKVCNSINSNDLFHLSIYPLTLTIIAQTLLKHINQEMKKSNKISLSTLLVFHK